MKMIYSHCGLSRQAHHQEVARQALQQSLHQVYVGMIDDCRIIHPGMGLKKMYAQLAPEGIGRDAFIALGLSEGYRLEVIKSAHHTTNAVKNCRYGNLLAGERFTDVNQIWVSDLFYFTRFDEHLYVVLIMDAYSRRIIGHSAADNMRSENFQAALEMALTLRGVDNYQGSLIHHSDRGSQYASELYTSTLEQSGIRISMCTTVLENAHSERANGTIKNDYLRRYHIPSPKAFPRFVTKACNSYNDRFHDSLKCSPNDYETNLLNIPMEERETLTIFTVSRDTQNSDNSGQLDLFKNFD